MPDKEQEKEKEKGRVSRHSGTRAGKERPAAPNPPRREADEREKEKKETAQPAGRAVPAVRREKRGGDPERFLHQVTPYVMFWVALFAAVSFVLRDILHLGDSAGAFGNWFADFLCGLWGPVAYALPFFLVVLALRWKTFVVKGILARKLILSALFLWLLAAIVHVFLQSDAARAVCELTGLYAAGKARTGGGLFGGFLGEWIGYFVRLPGTVLLAIPLLVIVGIYLVGLTPSGLWHRLRYKWTSAGEARRARREALYDGQEERGAKKPREARKAAAPAESSAVSLQWREPRSVPRREAPSYDFREEDEESVTPARPAPEPQPQPQQTAPKPPANDLLEDDALDAPDEVDAILRNTAAGDKLEKILEDMMVKTAPQPAPRPEERPLQGDYYAPFALPVRPEPKRGEHQTVAAPAPEETPGHVTVTPLGELPPQAADAGHETPAAMPAAPAESQTTPAAAVADLETENRDESAEEVLGADPAARAAFAAEAAARPQEKKTGAGDLYETLMKEFFDTEPAPKTADETETTGATVSPVDEPLSDEPLSGEPMVDAPLRDPFDVPAPLRATPPHTATPVFYEPPADEAEADEQFAALGDPVGDADEDEPAPVEARVERVTPDPVPDPVPPPSFPSFAPQAPVEARVERVIPDPAPAPVPPPAPRAYQAPPVTLLRQDLNVKDTDHTAEMQERAALLCATLNSFNVRVKDEVDFFRGPTVTRYEVRPEIGTSVRSIVNRIDDISLAMAEKVRIDTQVQGKSVIGIEVPNATRETVYMRTMLESEVFRHSTKPLEVPIGVDIGGNIILCDLVKMPHLLIAGTTGSGKSVCINTILVSLLYKNSPADLRLILIDPKQVEFTLYEHIPHLYTPIVVDAKRAVGALACATQEMERRYALMREVGVRQIDTYLNITKNDPEKEHLPYIVIVIDEFADLMLTAGADAEKYACRLAAKARAAGIHLIIGTQRPSVDVVTGQLKNNIPSRIAFTVRQQIDSRTIIDTNGAESLTSRGDMLYAPTGVSRPIRAQGAFMQDEEVERVTMYVREHNDPVQYSKSFMDQLEVEMARAESGKKRGDDFEDYSAESAAEDGEDPKFWDAVKVGFEAGKGRISTSLLQRRLGVGYGRAAKIIDRMEERGFVGEADGNKPRQLLITEQQYMEHLMRGDDEPDDGEDDFQ